LSKELKSRFRLDEINTTDPYIIEPLVIMAAISLMMSRVVVDELDKIEAERRDTAADADSPASWLSRRRCSVAINRHAHLIQLYLMVKLGYGLRDLDELLLWASQDPNPHRQRLLAEVELGET